MNLRHYLAGSGAAVLTWLFGQFGVAILIPMFAVIARLPISPFWVSFIEETIYWGFEGGLAFLSTLVATNLLPLSAQKSNSWIFATTGFILVIWLRVAFLQHFERQVHQPKIIYATLTDPFVLYFFAGALFCVFYVFLRKHSSR